MAGRAQTTVMCRLFTMLRAFPIEDMILWLLSPVTVLAEAVLILMTELT